MLRKVFRTGNSMVASLPREALECLDICESREIEINLDCENRQVILKLVGRYRGAGFRTRGWQSTAREDWSGTRQVPK
jgi:antitoxin component of MazEF toxin-antitoxin module